MAYKHGVQVSEVPTSILPPVQVSAGIPFIVGTAPINMTDTSNINKPVLCYTYDEAVAAFGYVPPKLNEVNGQKEYEYSISEFIYSQFALFGVAPVIIVNVLDPATHKTTATATNVTLDASTGSATIAETGILPSSVTITGTGAAYVLDTDYVVTFNDDGHCVITSLKNEDGSFKCTTGTPLTLAAQKLSPSMVTTDEIVGGVDVSGNKSGFELVGECFPRFRLVPGILLAPGYSSSPTVAAVMATKAANINGVFQASVALVDVPTDTVTHYSGVAEWKNKNNIVDALQTVCWPKISLDGVAFHMSTQMAGLIGQVDGDNDDVPYVSPSNKNFQMTAAIIASGKDVWLDKEEAEYLNSQGVVTALNFIGGWKCWGNRTACYPGNTDVKDAFIPIRRMFGWVGNTFVQTYWQRLDYPINRRQIETIIDSANDWLNGLVAKEYLLGGRAEYLDTENSTTDVMDGKLRFHVYLAAPPPNRQIDFVLEYDVSYLQTLFE